MKKIGYLLIIFILSISFALPKENKERFKVVKITDGDTLYIDFNRNNRADKKERARINGVDSFEVEINSNLSWQKKIYNLSEKEVLTLGYLAKEFAQKELLNKEVYVIFSAQKKHDKYNRPLVSIEYDCKNNKCKSYEKEILKQGLASVYKKSNLSDSLMKFENIKKIRKNAKTLHKSNVNFSSIIRGCGKN